MGYLRDIRVDVMFDDCASEGAIRELVYEVRKCLEKEGSEWEIITLAKRGYQMRRKENGVGG